MKLLETFWAKPQVFHFISVSSMFAPTFTCSRCGSVTYANAEGCMSENNTGSVLSRSLTVHSVWSAACPRYLASSDSRDRLRPSFNSSWLTLGGLKGQFTYFLCESCSDSMCYVSWISCVHTRKWCTSCLVVKKMWWSFLFFCQLYAWNTPDFISSLTRRYERGDWLVPSVCWFLCIQI